MVRSNGNAPSIISFAAQLKKGKKGEGRIEEAHLLRLLHNRLLQWRCVNARANASLSARRLAVEVKAFSFVLFSQMFSFVMKKMVHYRIQCALLVLLIKYEKLAYVHSAFNIKL